ncbi:hypothetical protein NVV94_14310 [Pseudomonas sp. LS1212]|uniref:hypothetical protein n=1 Tax=Pseudomonas sp. LS1212 TaxID=2972478 RepID=UPI00215B9EE2|nr:hypothetical protein [Pseudomonas sp. LS1212]UVJ41882.1 hypothetical protein NVV94_14310 [Pseudomonas sp. LS1212]
MRSLGWMVLGIASGMPGLAGAQSWDNIIGQDYYGQPLSAFSQEPLSYRSPPPKAYVSTSPQTFLVVPEPHDFHDSRLPAVGDVRPRVLIRTFDPELRVYVDTEVGR